MAHSIGKQEQCLYLHLREEINARLGLALVTSVQLFGGLRERLQRIDKISNASEQGQFVRKGSYKVRSDSISAENQF